MHCRLMVIFICWSLWSGVAQADSISQAPRSIGYTPSAAERMVFDLLVADDILGFAEGRETYAANKMNVAVTRAAATEVARVYAQDRVAAGKRYANRLVLMPGRVASAVQDETGTVSMVFADTGSLQVRARIADDSAVRRRVLVPGESVTLACKAPASAGKDLRFEDCHSGRESGERIWAGLRRQLDGFYRGERAEDVAIPTLAVNVALYAQALPADSGCPGNAQRCGAAWQSIGPFSGSQLKAVTSRFQKSGLDLHHFEDMRQSNN